MRLLALPLDDWRIASAVVRQANQLRADLVCHLLGLLGIDTVRLPTGD